MRRILLIGSRFEDTDFSDPALPPGLSPEKIAAAVEAARTAMHARGWETGHCAIPADATAEAVLASVLATRWDCIVIGGGIRLPASNLLLFERVVNAARRHAPDTPIAFNTSPADSADAAARWLGDTP